MRHIRKIKAKRLRELREKRGLSRNALADAAGLHFAHVAKMERGEVSETTPERAEALADALGVKVSTISSEPKPSELAVWAYAQGISLAYASELASEGRIEGAAKRGGRWHVAPDAKRLPPNQKTREKDREKYRKYRADYQRRRRARRSHEKGKD